MHDLRRRALESNKTQSRKALSRSQGSSQGNSSPASRAASRIQSREVSDDEEDRGEMSDDTSHSINSIDALLETDDINESATELDRWRLDNIIDTIVDRKNTNNKTREDFYTSYVKTLTFNLVGDVLYHRIDELLPAFLRSVKAETSEKETLMALRALSVTAVNFSEPSLYETVLAPLKRCISDSQLASIKAAAISSLAMCAYFGGAGQDGLTELMTFYQEIVSSDGAFIDAQDNAEVVTAALNKWAFLATKIEDLELESEDAVATFLDQLDSDNTKVQIAAGENIALLYEKCCNARERDDSTDEESEEEEELHGDLHEDRGRGHSLRVKRYTPYHNTKEVLDKVLALSNISTKSISRRDKQILHRTFTMIAGTVRDPKTDLQWNSASKTVVRINQEGEMHVDLWWKLLRLNALRRLLGSGFVNHYYQGNKQILDAIPIIMHDIRQGEMSKRTMLAHNRKDGKGGKTGGTGKYSRERRFVA